MQVLIYIKCTSFFNILLKSYTVSLDRKKSNLPLSNNSRQFFMKYLVILAIILVTAGIGLILYAVSIALKLKFLNNKKLVSDEELRKKIERLVPVNLAGLFLSAFGIIVLFVIKILG